MINSTNTTFGVDLNSPNKYSMKSPIKQGIKKINCIKKPDHPADSDVFIFSIAVLNTIANITNTINASKNRNIVNADLISKIETSFEIYRYIPTATKISAPVANIIS